MSDSEPTRATSADIGWICLSDTHFGAENSLLSDLPTGSIKVDVIQPSPVLEKLVECLAALVATNSGANKPTLVLNGDILEMALAEDNVAAMVFDRFIDLAFAGSQPIFDDTIVYLAGNHDHHMWETARERQYSDYVAGRPPDSPLEAPWHATLMFERDGGGHPQAELLTALVQRRGGEQLTVNVAYPNYAVGDDNRVVIFHHGHFIEALYRLMSTLRAAIFPGQQAGPDIWDWESDNFAWIDFFWSSLGRSGQAGEDVGLIYDCLQQPASIGLLASNLAAAAVGRIPHLPRLLLRPARWAIRPIIRRLATKVLTHERAHADILLTAGAEKGLDAFLKGPLRRQLERERPGGSNSDVNFVFGHTHKPFERVQRVDGFRNPVSVYNTGGWVVDTLTTKPVQGASIVVVDTAYQVASIRVYNQSDNTSDYRVTVGPDNSLLAQQLKGVIDFSAGAWADLSASVASAVAVRHDALGEIIKRGSEPAIPASTAPTDAKASKPADRHISPSG